MTDRDLIEGIIARERQAMNFLVNAYQKKVIKTAYYFTGDMNDAEDVSQEIFLDVIRSVENFRSSASLSTWIYRITVNRSLNFIRKRKRNLMFGKILLFQKSPRSGNGKYYCEPYTIQDNLEDQENRQWFKNALEKLPLTQRTAFILHQYEDLSYKEIAEVMHTSLSAVESLIHRAKSNLQRQLARSYSINLNHKIHGL